MLPCDGASTLAAQLNDDAVLFATWTLLRHRPRVVTVLRSVNQEANGITFKEREKEDATAMAILGCEWVNWPFPDDDPPWDEVEALLRRGELNLHDEGPEPDWVDVAPWPHRVFAPWPEPGGHEQHNRVGELAEAVFGSERVSFYTTYRYGGPRTVGREVEPEPWMIPLKLRALACYESQMLRGPRRFFLDSLREYELP